MDTHRDPALTSASIPAPGLARVAFAVGPTLTVLGVSAWLRASAALAVDQHLVALLTVLAVAWVPWPLSVPALWMQRFRDGVRRDLRRGVWPRTARAFVLAGVLTRSTVTAGHLLTLAAGLTCAVIVAMQL